MPSLTASPLSRLLGRLGHEVGIPTLVEPEPFDSPMHRLLRRIGVNVDVVLPISTGSGRRACCGHISAISQTAFTRCLLFSGQPRCHLEKQAPR